MCSFGSCQTRFEFLSQFRKVRNAFECFVTQVQTRLPKTKCVWPMKINVICTVHASFSHQIMSPFTSIEQHHHRHHQLHPVGHSHRYQQQVPAQHVPHQPHYVCCSSCGLQDSHKTCNGKGVHHSNCTELSSKAILINIHIKLMWSNPMVHVIGGQWNCVQNLCWLIQYPSLLTECRRI